MYHIYCQVMKDTFLKIRRKIHRSRRRDMSEPPPRYTFLLGARLTRTQYKATRVSVRSRREGEKESLRREKVKYPTCCHGTYIRLLNRNSCARVELNWPFDLFKAFH